MAIAVDAAGMIGLAALAVAAVRRYVFTPPRLERSSDATLILILITIVLSTSLAASASRTPSLYLTMWWLAHGDRAGVPGLPAVLQAHAPAGVAVRRVLRFARAGPHAGGVRGRLAAGAVHLAATVERVRLRRMRALRPGLPEFRERQSALSEDAGSPREGTGAGDAAAANRSRAASSSAKRSGACATCAACMEECPVFNEHIPLIVEMRRHLVSQGDIEGPLQDTLTNFSRYGNSFGTSPRARTKWTQGLEFKSKDARKEPVEYLWFVGDYASYDPRLQPVTRATARVFQRAGLNFGILYEAEQNSGNDVRRIGEEGLFEMLREKNQGALGKAKYRQDRHLRSSHLQRAEERVSRHRQGGAPLHGADGGTDSGGQAAGAARARTARSPTMTPATWAATTASTTRPGGCSRRWA